MLIVVACFVKFLKNTLDFKDVAKMLPKMLYLCSNQNGTNMASIELSTEPTLKSKAGLKCLYFTIIIFDLCRYM